MLSGFAVISLRNDNFYVLADAFSISYLYVKYVEKYDYCIYIAGNKKNGPTIYKCITDAIVVIRGRKKAKMIPSIFYH